MLSIKLDGCGKADRNMALGDSEKRPQGFFPVVCDTLTSKVGIGKLSPERRAADSRQI